MKTFEISCRKVKISISPRGGKFQFSARGEINTCISKKSHPGVSFTSPTCNMPLSAKVILCEIFPKTLTHFMSYEKQSSGGVLTNFVKFTGKHLCQSLFFNKVADLRSPTLVKKETLSRLQLY